MPALLQSNLSAFVIPAGDPAWRLSSASSVLSPEDLHGVALSRTTPYSGTGRSGWRGTSDIEYSSGVSAHHVFLSNCAAEVVRVCLLKALPSLLAASDPKTRSVSGHLAMHLWFVRAVFSTCKAMEGLLRLCRSLLMFESDLVIQAITRGAAQVANGVSACNLKLGSVAH